MRGILGICLFVCLVLEATFNPQSPAPWPGAVWPVDQVGPLCGRRAYSGPGLLELIASCLADDRSKQSFMRMS
eukprot:15006735-Alexandrium_andersonii.AAC.1